MEHSTNLSSKHRIVQDRCLRPAPNEAVFRTFDVCGFLSDRSAPPCVFFDTTPGDSTLDFNRIASFPVSSEPDELLAKLALNVNELLAQDDGHGGDVRLFFAGLLSAPRKGPSFLSPRVRAVVVLAKAEDFEAMRSVGAVEMDPSNNALFFKDGGGKSQPGDRQSCEDADVADEPNWNLATSVNYQGRPCRLSVIFAVPRSVQMTGVTATWLAVSRVNQVRFGFTSQRFLFRRSLCEVIVFISRLLASVPFHRFIASVKKWTSTFEGCAGYWVFTIATALCSDFVPIKFSVTLYHPELGVCRAARSSSIDGRRG